MGSLLVAGVLCTSHVAAQTVCQGQPWLGANGPELCVEIRDEGTLDTWVERFNGFGGTVNRTVGTWRVNLTFSYTVGDGGMAMTIGGEVWRQLPGSGWLNVRGDGGTNVTIAGDTGSLWLDGEATAASAVVVGGGAGVRLPGGGDIQFTGFPQTIDVTTVGPGSFHDEISEIPVSGAIAAVTNTTGFHANEVGDLIDVPSGSVSGDVPTAIAEIDPSESSMIDRTATVLEARLAPLAAVPQPDLLVVGLYQNGPESTLRGYRVRSGQYRPAVVIDDGVIDSEPLYGVHKVCPLGVDLAYLAYISFGATSTNVNIGRFENEAWSTFTVGETVDDDYHAVTCFTSSNGAFFAALNFSASTVDVFKMTPGGDFTLWGSYGSEEWNGTPESPIFGGPIPKAGDLPTWGVGGIDTAILSTGLVDGSLAVGRLDTSTGELTEVRNLGQANGETSADIHFNEVTRNYIASVNWMNGPDLWTYRWTLDGPVQERTIKLGQLETGTVIDGFQGLAGAGNHDGRYYVFADKGYRIDDQTDSVTELPRYPFRTMGGPVDLFMVDNPEIDGFLVGPSGLRLGILGAPPKIAGLSVPAVARVRGAGAFFTSVMHLFNPGQDDMDLEMTFTPRAGSGGGATTVSHTAPAGVMQTIEDPLEELFGFTGSAGRVGSIVIEAVSGSIADLMVQTVVFAELDSGERYGQFFPSMRAQGTISAGQKAYLNTTEDPTHNRVNVGLMAATDGTGFRVTPMDPLGTPLAPTKTTFLDLGESSQINDIHSTFGLGTMSDLVIEIEVISGAGLAYSSVLDGSGAYGGTSDPTTILPVTGGSSKVTLLEIGSIQGLNEFSGSASITNYSNRSATVRADFFQRDIAGVTASETISIGAGDTVGYSDLGAELFGISGDVGTVVLTATNGTEIGATGREFAIFRDGGEIVGTAGQLIAGLTDDDRLNPGTTYHFIGLRQQGGGSGVERSHFAVFNPATTDGRVTVRLYDAASGAFEGERTWVVPSATLIQVNNVIREINPGSNGAEKRIEVDVNRKVFMNAFRVNPWGDPVTLSPFAR